MSRTASLIGSFLPLALLAACGQGSFSVGEPPVPDVEQPAPDDEDEPLPPAEVASELRSTHWTRYVEGSLGTYYTWFSFEADSLEVAFEVRNSVEPDAVEGVAEWVTVGAWSASDTGVVTMDWEEQFSWGAPAQHTDSWTFTAPSEALADQLVPSLYRTGAPWMSLAYRAVDARTYRGEYHSSLTMEDYFDSRSQIVEITFAAPIEVGEPCAVTVRIEAEEVHHSGEFSEGVEQFDWTCRASEEAGLIRVQIGDFAGTRAEISAQWRAELAELQLPYGVERIMQRAFVPELYVDPADRTVLASWTDRPMLTEDEGPAPPLAD